jgi:hypothetical protein
MAAVKLKWTEYEIIVWGRERGRPTNLLILSVFPKYAIAWLHNIMDCNLTMRVTTSASCIFSLSFNIIIMLIIFFPYYTLGNIPDK